MSEKDYRPYLIYIVGALTMIAVFLVAILADVSKIRLYLEQNNQPHYWHTITTDTISSDSIDLQDAYIERYRIKIQ